MFRNSTLLAALICSAAAGTLAYAAAPAAGPKPMPAVKAEMKKIVDPASTLLFAVGGDVDPANGPDLKPQPASRWKAAGDAAGKLAAAGEWLRKPGNGVTNADWIKAATEMTTLATAARKAARAHDGAKLSQAANDLSDNCTTCHKVYKPQTG